MGNGGLIQDPLEGLPGLGLLSAQRKLQSNYVNSVTLSLEHPDRYSHSKKTKKQYDRFRGSSGLLGRGTEPGEDENPQHPQVDVPVWAFDLAEYSKVLAAAVGNTVHLWDLLETPELKVSLQGHTDQVWCVRFSTNESTLATGSNDCTIRLWEGATGKPLNVLEAHTAGIRSLAFSETGLLVSGGMDGWMMLWEYGRETPLEKWEAHEGGVHDHKFFCTELHPELVGNEFENRYFGGQGSRKVIRDEKIYIDAHAEGDGFKTQYCTEGMWMEEDKFAAVLDGRLYVAHFTSQGPMTCKLDLNLLSTLKSGSVGGVVSSFKRCLVTQVSKFTPVLGLGVALEEYREITINADPRKFEPWAEERPQTCVSVGADGEFALWMCSKQTVCDYGRFPGGDGGSVLCVACHPRNCGILACGNQDGSVWFWYVKPPHPPLVRKVECTGHNQLQGHKPLPGTSHCAVWAVAFSPDGMFLASGSSDRTIRVWVMSDGIMQYECPQQMAVFMAHSSWVRQIRFKGGKGRLPNMVSCSADGTIKVWVAPNRLKKLIQEADLSEERQFYSKIGAIRALQELIMYAEEHHCKPSYKLQVVTPTLAEKHRLIKSGDDWQGAEENWDLFKELVPEHQDNPVVASAQQVWKCTLYYKMADARHGDVHDHTVHEVTEMSFNEKPAQEKAVMAMQKELEKPYLKAWRKKKEMMEKQKFHRMQEEDHGEEPEEVTPLEYEDAGAEDPSALAPLPGGAIAGSARESRASAPSVPHRQALAN